MDSATTTAAAVPSIPLPEGTDLDWVAVWLTVPEDQLIAVAENLIAEKGAKWKQRFSSLTGEPLPNPRIEWVEEDVAGIRRIHFELEGK